MISKKFIEYYAIEMNAIGDQIIKITKISA